MLRVAEQKFTTTTETFEGKLVEVQRKTREEVKEEFNGKIIEMPRVQVQLQQQMMQTDYANDATISTNAVVDLHYTTFYMIHYHHFLEFL